MNDKEDIKQFLKEKDFQKKIDEFAKKYQDKTVMLYGAGISLGIISKYYDLSRLNIIGIADKKFSDGENYNGFKTYNSHTFMKAKPDIVLISIYEHEVLKTFFEETLMPEIGDFKYEPFINYPYEERFKKDIDALKDKINSQEKIKVILGCGGKHHENWISTDVKLLDITNKDHWQRYFNEESIDNLLAEHVFEHLELEEAKTTFQNIYKYLKKSGVLRFATPDGYHPSEYYKNQTKPGGEGSGSYDHKLFFTIDLLKEIIDKEKFDIIPIEYFDKSGVFHKENHKQENGCVERIAENQAGRAVEKFYESTPEHLREHLEKNNYAYTSLFVDIIKK